MNSPLQKKLLPFDYAIIFYSLLMFLIILLIGRPLSAYYGSLVFYVSMAATAALISRYVDPTRNRLLAFVRYIYPMFMGIFFYTATGGLMFLLFDHFLDSQLVAFEKAVLGVNPTLYIDRHLLNVWVTELLSLSYFSYYPMIPIFVFTLFVKKQYRIISSATTTILLIFFSGYLLFFLYPIEGPRWHYAAQYINAIEGPFFRPMVEYVIDNGAVRGGCMPSTHFAIFLALMLYCFKHYRKTGWLLLPICIGLGAGTVWGRFHYISDVIVGGIMGLLATWFVMKFYGRWTNEVYKTDKPEKVITADVS